MTTKLKLTLLAAVCSLIAAVCAVSPLGAGAQDPLFGYSVLDRAPSAADAIPAGMETDIVDRYAQRADLRKIGVRDGIHYWIAPGQVPGEADRMICIFDYDENNATTGVACNKREVAEQGFYLGSRHGSSLTLAVIAPDAFSDVEVGNESAAPLSDNAALLTLSTARDLELVGPGRVQPLPPIG